MRQLTQFEDFLINRSEDIGLSALGLCFMEFLFIQVKTFTE